MTKTFVKFDTSVVGPGGMGKSFREKSLKSLFCRDCAYDNCSKSIERCSYYTDENIKYWLGVDDFERIFRE